MITRPLISMPSFTQDFARSAGEAKNPYLWKGLVGAWAPFLGKQGQNLYDWSGKKNHGILINMISDDWVPSRLGMALDYDGTNQLASISSPSFVSNDQGSISIRFKSTDLTFGALFSVDSAFGTNEFRVDFSQTGNKDISIVLILNTVQLVTNSPNNTINDNDWHHIVVTSDGSEIKLYVDNELKILTDAVGTNSGQWFGDVTSATKAGIAAANRPVPIHTINATIGNVAIYNRVLSVNEIKHHSENPWALFEPKRTFRPPLWFFEGSIFQANGTAISPIISIGGDVVDWSSFSNVITTPGDSSVTAEIRTTNDGITWSGYGAIGSAADSIFAQIKLTLNANSGDTSTPTVDIIKLRALLISAIQPFHFEGIKSIKIDDGDSPYTALLVPEKEVLIECDTDGGAITVDMLPELDVAGKVYNIKNTGTSGNDVTVDDDAAANIGTIIDGNSLKIVSNGISWVTI